MRNLKIPNSDLKINGGVTKFAEADFEAVLAVEVFDGCMVLVTVPDNSVV